jgi:tRNA (cytosine40_48-C5)-methyltransferase
MISELANKYDYLPYMIDRYLKMLGTKETKEFLKANDKPLKQCIRINTLKTDIQKLLSRLEKKGLQFKQIDQIPYGFKILKSRFSIGATHEFLQGYYYIQNAASMLPAIVLSPKSSELIIDMCAAPGSKATQIAQEMNNQGSLVLIERNARRVPKLEYNLRRLSIKNYILINLDAKNLSKLHLKADGILLDAPCTGEGLIRQDPKRKKNKKLSDIEKLASFQKQLLKAGLESLKSGGRLVYSTCSVAPEENEFVVDDVLNEDDNYSILKIDLNYGVKGFKYVFNRKLRKDLVNSVRLYPHIDDTIGFFICLIQKN